MKARDQVEEHGFAFLPAYYPHDSTLDACARLGRVAILRTYPPIQTLRPTPQFEASPASYSGTYGLDTFPLHTDLAHWALPPRYFLLRCIEGDPRISTPVLDGLVLQSAIGTVALHRALVQPRRPLAGRVSLLRLLDMSGGTPTLLRWDERFIRPVTRQASDTWGRVVKFLLGSVVRQMSLLQCGDTLIIDNWRMLHGRSNAVSGTIRHVERAYLEAIH